MSFFKDFKAFVSRGNVVDMAVGVVVGGAFGKIVSSLVADIITPLISLLTGGATLAESYVCLNADEAFSYASFPTVALANEAGYATLNYGIFVQTIIDFLLIALSIFCVIRIITKSREKLEAKKKAEETAAAAEAAAAAPAEPVETAEDILRDIRTMLEKK
ncbi:MAG: large conductance mechanosensitive channel protein MscL [Clostridia bacterium]|nr:large conductance mechanosensitive channel protein MscL [Clostridia bacterium]